jgi:hypothetical protein
MESAWRSAVRRSRDAVRARRAIRKIAVGALAGLALLVAGLAQIAASAGAPPSAPSAARQASFPTVPALAQGAPAGRAHGAPAILARRSRAHARPTRQHRKRTPKAPTVTTQPRSESVATGQIASFTATASGTPAPKAQWQRSANAGRSWRNIAGARGVSYSFTAGSSENGDEYRVLFTNSAGRASTNDATLTLAAPASGGPPPVTTTPPGGGEPPVTATAPQVTTQPTGQTLEDGASATFTAAASGSPTPSVQWEVSSNGGGSWSAIAGATSAGFSFTASSSQNGDEFRAVFANTAGSAATNPATLTITGPPGAPQVTSQPDSETVAVDASATFTATAAGSPTPSVQWEVSSNGGGSWSAIAGATSASYSFTAGSAQNTHEYRAAFSNAHGSVTTNAATLTVAEESSNWSGYAATGGGFSAVSGSWTVPSVTCPAGTTTYSSQWIGIDGYASDTVEQDGTGARCLAGTPNYNTWYEMYGDEAVADGYEVPLSSSSYPVSAGDAMTASVSLSGSMWTLAIADTTRGWNYSIEVASPQPAPARSSAEWIVERPEVGPSLSALSDFASASFSGASATDNTTSGSISAFSFQPLEMVGSTLLAAPGALEASGASFADTWYASS